MYSRGGAEKAERRCRKEAEERPGWRGEAVKGEDRRKGCTFKGRGGVGEEERKGEGGRWTGGRADREGKYPHHLSDRRFNYMTSV